MKFIGLLLLLAVPGFGQVTTDCYEVYRGRVRCNSTDNRMIQRPLFNSRIQIPDFVGDNRRREWDRMEGLRRSMETRALIDQMRSQTQMNNAITRQLIEPRPETPQAQPAPAKALDFHPVPTPQVQAAIEYPEVLDYVKGLLARNKAGEMSVEMFKHLANLKLNEWVDSLRARGVTPIQVDKSIALAKQDMAPMKKDLK